MRELLISAVIALLIVVGIPTCRGKWPEPNRDVLGRIVP